VAFTLIWWLGRRLLPHLLHAITRTGPRELFTLTVLFLALATAWITAISGLSLAMGAFLAGMLLGETLYRHQIEADARPFKDLLMGLFFVTVGMELDLPLLPSMWLETVILLFGITLGKGALIFVLVWMARLGSRAAMRTALLLGHGGEFGIALLALAIAHGVLSHEAVQPVLAAMIVSMLVAPLLVRKNRALVDRLLPESPASTPSAPMAPLEETAKELQDHVIIAGFGRFGQNLATFLRKLGIPYIALDLDPDVIRRAALAGEPVFYGDCARHDVLERAGLARARVLVTTFDEPASLTRTLAASCQQHAGCEVLARTRDDRHFEDLLEKGAKEVIPETLEGSLALARHLLRRLDYAEADIQPLVDSIRRDGYRALRITFRGGDETQRSQVEHLETVVLSDRSHATGRRLGDLDLHAAGVQVVAIRRHGIRGDEPLEHTCLQAGDALVLEGTTQQLDAAQRRLQDG